MWAGTTRRVLRSTDAGRRWTNVTPAAGPATAWSSFFALDDEAAWVVSSSFGSRSYRILRTFDGGRTWASALGSLPGGAISNLMFVDRLHGWATVRLGAAAGSEGVAVLASSNGGASWKLIAESGDPSTGQPGPSGISFSCDKQGAVFATPTVGFLSQECAGGPLAIYRTTDGGFRWTLMGLPYLGPASALSYNLDPIFLTTHDAVMQAFYYEGQSTVPTPALLVTHDAGATWHAFAVPGQGAIDFESTTSGWLLGSRIHATTNGASSWRALAVPAPPFVPSDVQLQDLGRGIALAWGRTVAFRTDDGANTWRAVTPPGLQST